MSSKQTLPWTLIIVGGGMLSGGLALFAFGIAPVLNDSRHMQQWHHAQAIITQVTLNESYTYDANNRKSKTLSLSTSYHYQVNGVKYSGQRIGLLGDGGGDNTHQRASKLEQHKETGNTITVYYNPQNPAESILFRDIPWGQIAMFSFFALGFIGVGAAVAWSGFRRKGNLRKQA